MSVRSFLISRVAEAITSEERLRSRRAREERRRRAAGERHRIDYFHQVDDPYSWLLVQALRHLLSRYDVDMRCHLVSAPQDWAAPERAMLEAWSRIDAERLAAKAGLRFVHAGSQPDASRVAQAEAAAAAAIRGAQSLEDLARIGEALWSGASMPEAHGDAAAEKQAGDALRRKLGHYLSGTLHYGGEWYWGIDRLHYLEERLTELGARRVAGALQEIYPQPLSPRADAAAAGGGAIHYYLSFRSPYTYISAERAKGLADAYGLELKLRFVLPMVMRGLPVPPAKRNYITMDAAREARRAGVPFGRVADPVGRPVERGYSLLPWAITQGRGHEYCLAFMRAVWSQGVDAGSDRGMRRIVEAAGLDWSAARPLIGNDDWRAEAEANRLELTSLGLWGVPSFRFNGISAWGQDRLWVIEDAIRASRGMS